MNKVNPCIALVSEYPPPAAGMTILAEDLYQKLSAKDVHILKVKTNGISSKDLFVNKVRIIRSLVNWLYFMKDCQNIIRANVVHIFSSSGLNFILFTLPSLFIGRLTGSSIIIHYHGGAAEVFFKKYKFLLSIAVSLSDKLIVPSGFLKKVFKDLGYESEIIGNIVDTNKFKYKLSNNITPVILSIRNLTKVYNISCTLRAFQILQIKHPNARLIIAGSGEEEKKLIELSDKLKLNNVSFIGNIENNKIPELMEKSDILINSSRVDNMPGSVLEAFSSGIPVVSTNVGGIPYIIEDKVSGLLANDDEHKVLGQHLIELTNNNELYKTISENAYKFVMNFNSNIITNQWIKEYIKLYR